MADVAVTSPIAQALLYSTPQTVPLQQRSQYLLNALNALHQSTQQGIRTPVALGANLLADAILQGSRGSNDSKLIAAGQQQRNAALNYASGLMPGGDASAPSVDPAKAAIVGALTPQPDAPANMAPPPTIGGYIPQHMSFASGGPAGAPLIADSSAQGAPRIAPTMPQVPQPQAQGGPPTQTVTDAQWNLVRRELAYAQQSGDPNAMQQALAHAAQLQQQSQTPLTPDRGHGWAQGPTGQWYQKDYAAQYAPAPGAGPGRQLYTDTTGNHVPSVVDLGTSGAVPSGQSANPDGSLSVRPVHAGQTTMPYGALTSQDIGTYTRSLREAPSVQLYQNVLHKAAPLLMGQMANGAWTDIKRVDTVFELSNGSPTQAVREGFFNSIKDAQGIFAQYVNGALNAATMGEHGFLSDNYRRQLDAAIRQGVAERYEQAKDYIDTAQRQDQGVGYPESVYNVIGPRPPYLDNTPQTAVTLPPGAVRVNHR